MSRKTLDVEEFKNRINHLLKVSVCSPDTRQGLINALEDVLHSTGNYRGFSYLTGSEVPKDQLPGINHGFYGESEEQLIARFKCTDPTRVSYR